MAKVITLEGLPSAAASVSGELRECSSTVRAYSPTLQQEVDVCVEDGQRTIETRAQGMRKPRGRPRGTTVARGAKKPRVTVCQTTHWIQKGKRGICKCNDKGNSQILPHSSCGKQREKRKE